MACCMRVHSLAAVRLAFLCVLALRLSLGAAAPSRNLIKRCRRSAGACRRSEHLTLRRRTSEVAQWALSTDVDLKPFIYVYELPPEYNEAFKALPAGWHSDQYDFDITLHEYLLNSTRRQRDPDKASIFFMPVYLARLFNWFWTRQHCKSEADSPLSCMKEPDVDPWWDQHWVGAQNATSNVVRAAIKHISTKYPYWNRTNGADHFLVYSYDRGRCDMGAGLALPEMGKSFAVMSYGDLAARSIPTPTWHRNDNSDGWGFEWKGAAGFHCVRPDFDIIVPMYAPYTRKALVSPFSHPRNISVLLRFKVDKTDGKYLIANHGHRLRYELEDWWAKDPIAGSELGVKNMLQTQADMQNAVFCVCPPGGTQDSTRMWRSLIYGCIPVTYYRAVELPFMRRLGIDYGQFSVNIQPDDYDTTQARLRALLERPERVRALQEGVLQHQAHFLWDPALGAGVYGNIERELAMRAVQRATGETISVF